MARHRSLVDALDAAQHLLQYPTPVHELRDRLAQFENARAGLTLPPVPGAPAGAELLADPLAAVQRHREQSLARQDVEEAIRLLTGHVDRIRFNELTTTIQAHADQLVGETIRDTIDQYLADARDLLPTLRRVVRETNMGEYVAEFATSEELQAWQDSRAIQQRLDTLTALWKSVVTPRAAG